MKRNLSIRENLKLKEVKKMKKGIILGLMVLVILALTVPVKAATIIVDDWTFDFSVIDPTLPTISNIQQITVTGVAHTEIVNDVGPAGLSIGDVSLTDGFLYATGFTVGGSQVNLVGYEVTFDFSIASEIISIDPITGAITGQHVLNGGVDSLLDIYVDDLTDAIGVQASTNTGDGFRDGVLGATLKDDVSGISIFTPVSFDGSDDAVFENNCPTCFVTSGLILADIDGDSLLDDLALGGIMLAITDTNYDADPGDPTPDGFDLLEPTNWGTYFPRTDGGDDFDADGYADNSSPTAHYVREDGSASLGFETQVPEPATMLLLGSGLLGLGFYSRRMKK